MPVGLSLFTECKSVVDNIRIRIQSSDIRIESQMDQCLIPTAEAFVAAVQSLDLRGLKALSKKAEVPYATLWNIHRGASRNPQLETVRKLWPHLVA